MKIKSIKINYYRSYGENNNLLVLDDVNTIIGKNESGKSNIIDCLSRVDLTGTNDNELFVDRNKNYEKSPYFSFVLIPYDNEMDFFKNRDETIITTTSKYDLKIEGALSNIIVHNKEFQKNRELMNEKFDNIQKRIPQDQKDEIIKVIDMINDAENTIFIHYTSISSIIAYLRDYDSMKEFYECFIKCKDYLMDLYEWFPNFILIKDLSLKSTYTVDDLKDNKVSKEMLLILLKVIGYDMELFLSYWSLKSPDDQENFKEEINWKINELMEKFNVFYSQEKVIMRFSFENNKVSILIKTTNKYLNFDERSGGLKWYLNLFVQLMETTSKAKITNAVILIDEPGIFLHINAQKELIKLFDELSEQNNQIIYTTHSPFMISKDKMNRARLIIKDTEGNSQISNKYYTFPHGMNGAMDTITPIVNALGSDYSNIDFLHTDKIIIIVEGMSDYYYLKAYFVQKAIKDKYIIIPSAGVSNIHNLVSILVGWGCTIKVLIDQDKAGRKEYNVIIKNNLIDKKDIHFIEVTNDLGNKNITIENLFSEEDKKEIGILYPNYESEKAFYSLALLGKIENRDFLLSESTMLKFEEVLKKMIPF